MFGCRWQIAWKLDSNAQIQSNLTDAKYHHFISMLKSEVEKRYFQLESNECHEI